MNDNQESRTAPLARPGPVAPVADEPFLTRAAFPRVEPFLA